MHLPQNKPIAECTLAKHITKSKPTVSEVGVDIRTCKDFKIRENCNFYLLRQQNREEVTAIARSFSRVELGANMKPNKTYIYPAKIGLDRHRDLTVTYSFQM